jgi:hypothetical protein
MYMHMHKFGFNVAHGMIVQIVIPMRNPWTAKYLLWNADKYVWILSVDFILSFKQEE